MTRYRPEIDGLRAVAVAAVVVFHAGLGLLPGGFAGVDVFFVISGYLITRALSAQIDNGSFRFADFYERRARRILPALIAHLVISLGVFLVIATPDQLARGARVAIGALFAAGNIVLWRQSGYFTADSEFEPFLHTWSLGVEEQFYFALPPLLLVAARLSLNRKVVLGAATAASFALSVWLSHESRSAAFYLIPTRAWEIGIGALLGCGALPPIRSPLWRECAALLGACLVLASLCWFDARTVFPGWAALAPCAGTALVLHAAAPGGAVHKILSARPLVFVGLISYSLYLWHWFVFVALRTYLAVEDLSIRQAALGVAISVALAVASWRFIERPLRDRRAHSMRVVAAWLGAGSVLVVAGAIAAIAADGFPSRLDPIARRYAEASGGAGPTREACRGAGSLEDMSGSASSACRLGPTGAPIDFVVWGDSHAAAMRPAFERWAEEVGRAGLIAWSPGCPPLPGARYAHRRGGGEACARFRRRAMDALEGADSIESIFLVARWTSTYTGARPEKDDAFHFALSDHSGTALGPAHTKRVFIESLDRAMDQLGARGARVVVLGSMPDVEFDVPRTLTLAEHNRGGARRDRWLTRRARARMRETDAAIERLVASHERAVYVPLWPHLC